MPNQHSEIVRLREAIRAEYEAAQRGLSGLALGTAQHELIIARMENLTRRVNELRQVAGEEEVKRVLMQLGETTL